MRPPLAVLSLLLLLSGSFAFTQTDLAHQDVTTTKAIAAFSQAPVQGVQLSGVAHAIAGSTNENGTFSLDLQSTGESKLELAGNVRALRCHRLAPTRMTIRA